MVPDRLHLSHKRCRPAKGQALLVLLALALLALGEWAGEDMVETRQLVLILGDGRTLLAAVAAFILWCAAGRSWRRAGARAVASAMLVAALAAGLWGGSVVEARAFNACVARGEDVRAALEAYRVAHGEYPPSLAALGWPRLPGARLLHGNLLTYESDRSSYRLRFRDWFYEYRASNESAFMAHK